jgi:hypothetical protein
MRSPTIGDAQNVAKQKIASLWKKSWASFHFFIIDGYYSCNNNQWY